MFSYMFYKPLKDRSPANFPGYSQTDQPYRKYHQFFDVPAKFEAKETNRRSY